MTTKERILCTYYGQLFIDAIGDYERVMRKARAMREDMVCEGGDKNEHLIIGVLADGRAVLASGVMDDCLQEDCPDAERYYTPDIAGDSDGESARTIRIVGWVHGDGGVPFLDCNALQS